MQWLFPSRYQQMLADVSNCPQKLLRLLKLFRGWGWGRGIRRRWLTKVPEIGNENRSEKQPILDLWDNVLYSWILYWEIPIERSPSSGFPCSDQESSESRWQFSCRWDLLFPPHAFCQLGWRWWVGNKGGVLSSVVKSWSQILILNLTDDPGHRVREMQAFENMSRKKNDPFAQRHGWQSSPV